MSVFEDKRVFGIKKRNCGGVTTAGQVCANEVILWTIFMLPVNVVIHGAGQCLVFIGLFAGNVIGWIFLSKRMNSYTTISKKKIHNAPELFGARYDSVLLKNFVSFVWIIALGLILVSVLKVIVSVVAYFMETSETICLLTIVLFLILSTILIDNRLMGIIKTIVFIMVIFACLSIIGMVFYKMDVTEVLDNYRRARLPGGTSVYLNILYFDGEPVSVCKAISMIGIGLGCISMPLMYKGVISIKNVKELDKGRIWAIIFEGFTIISTSALALFVLPVIYPLKVRENMNSFQVYNLIMKKLLNGIPYEYIIRSIILLVFIAAVVVMLESFMRNISEHIRGMLPSLSGIGVEVKLVIDILVVLFTGILVFLPAEYASFDREAMIVGSWNLCSATLAAPLMFALLYRNSTKAGAYAGMIFGALVCFVWNWVPLIEGCTMYRYTSLNGGVIGFAISFFMCAFVGRFTKKNSEEELLVFDRMVEDQA
ncbi:MAG: hypothetical protein J6A82_02125 [Coprococcus sp.]|nr:hypothetical protein [Coprococcus sp.]